MVADPLEVRYVEANGVRFGYLEAGSGPLALCLHGFPDSAHTWRHLLPLLAEVGYHAVAPFMRGYAPTGVPGDGAYQTGALVADANALHEALGGGPDAVLIGHDWGAFAAYGATAHEPGRWRRVVAVAVPPPAVIATGFVDYAQLKRSFYVFVFQTPLAAALVEHDGKRFIDELWRDWSPGYPAGTDVALVKECLRDPANLDAALGYYRAMLDPRLHLPRYAAEQQAADKGGGCPVLYLHGAADGCIGAEIGARAMDHLPPGSEAEVMPGVGHFLHLEDPEGFGRRILGWLARDDRPAG